MLDRNVNCIFLVGGNRCTNEQVKKTAWGWSDVCLCVNCTKESDICRYRQAYPLKGN